LGEFISSAPLQKIAHHLRHFEKKKPSMNNSKASVPEKDTDNKRGGRRNNEVYGQCIVFRMTNQRAYKKADQGHNYKPNV
jgi:hypothetical protein